MELINRYLQAVRYWLPKQQRDDIIAELSEEIRSQVEERERETGRKLDDSEIAAVLKRLGPPATAANRYLPQRSLIGPAVFPAYVLVLKIMFVCCVVPQVLLLFRRWTIGGGAPGESWLAAWGRAGSSTEQSLLFAVGLVTVIFAVIEWVSARNKPKHDWDPLKLPPVRDPPRIRRSSSIFDLVFSVLILSWWAGYIGFQTVFEIAGTRVTLDPSWVYFVGSFVLVMLGHVALAGVNLFRPRWTVARAGVRLAIDGAGGVLFCWLLKAGVLREALVAVATKAKMTGIVDGVRAGSSKAFAFAVVVCAIIVLVDMRRIFQASEKGPGGREAKPGSGQESGGGGKG
jgi:hypothetical protein